MKFTIELDTEVDGQACGVRYLLSPDLYAAVSELSEQMRTAAKHGGDEGAAKWREKLYEILLSYNIILD